MIDRAWLARLLRRVRADSALPRTSRELSDVAANNLPRDVIGIASRRVQPTEEMREANRISALCVDRTIAQTQLRQKLIAGSNTGVR
jgi:hypothetical protein